MVVKNGLELTVDATELVETRSAGGQTDGHPMDDVHIDSENGPTAGALVSMRLPKELLSISPGFYLACANRPMDPVRGRQMVRLYWNLRADGAVPFVAAATRRLNSADAAFRLKVLNDPDAFDRCDAAVIYLARDEYPGLADLILGLQAEIRDFLSPLTPVFTAELAPGLGFAEDPGTAESFGQQRCRLLANALVQSHESGSMDDAARLADVEIWFAQAGIDLAAAHLSPVVSRSPAPLVPVR